MKEVSCCFAADWRVCNPDNWGSMRFHWNAAQVPEAWSRTHGQYTRDIAALYLPSQPPFSFLITFSCFFGTRDTQKERKREKQWEISTGPWLPLNFSVSVGWAVEWVAEVLGRKQRACRFGFVTVDMAYVYMLVRLRRICIGYEPIKGREVT